MLSRNRPPLAVVLGLLLAGILMATPARAQLFTKVGTFAGDSSGGPPGPRAQSITGVGFQPKAVIFFWTAQTAAGFATNAAVGYGFATGLGSERSVVFAETDNRTSTNFNARSYQSRSASILLATAPSTALDAQARLTGMTADGFDIEWNAAPSSAWLIHYLAIGGPDVTNATVGTDKPATCVTPCSQNYTGVGFQPELLMFLSVDDDLEDQWVDGYTDSDTNGPGGRVSLGFAGDSGGTITQGAVIATSQARSSQNNAITTIWEEIGSSILEKDCQGASQEFQAQLTSFDAIGFTFNIQTNVDESRTNFHYLALKGGRYKLGSITKPAVTGSQSYTGVGFTPHGMAFFSWNVKPGTGPSTDQSGRISFSAADAGYDPTGTPPFFPPTQAATFLGTQTDLLPTKNQPSWVRQGTSSSKAIYLAQAGDCPVNNPEGAGVQCSAGPRVLGDADVTSYDADGFTLDWTTIVTTASIPPSNHLDDDGAQVIYLAMGNDETTAVTLSSLTATAGDGEVLIEWETASELKNLGFHLYRSTAEDGDYVRVTSDLIPGLGSSPSGASYRYLDTGLTNGVTYTYQLEDIETTGDTHRHGPVRATPVTGASIETESTDDQDEGSEDLGARIVYGDPSGNGFRLLRSGRNFQVVELRTEGFYAYPQRDGTVRLSVPGFVNLDEPGEPAIPVSRHWVEALANRKVSVERVREDHVESVTGWSPEVVGSPELVVTQGGTVRADTRRGRARGSSPRGFGRSVELYPSEAARVLTEGFQGEEKRALLELSPLRWDAAFERLLLARRLVVRIDFTAGDAETANRRRQHEASSHREQNDRVQTRIRLREPGLYGVRFEEAFPSQSRGMSTEQLRLSRQRTAVAYRVEPEPSYFGPGSVLYFVSEGAEALSPYGREVVYELEQGAEGTPMEEVSASPRGSTVDTVWHRKEREENHLYQAALLEAEDVWQWDWVFSGVKKSFGFQVQNLATAPEPSRLRIRLEGASDFPVSPDHHVRVSVNGVFITEASWDGKEGRTLEGELSAGVLHPGENVVEVENVGDTSAQYSVVMVDRFEVVYPHELEAENGVLRGVPSDSGTLNVTGLGSAATYVVDVTDAKPRWLTDIETRPTGEVSFRGEADREYLVVSADDVKRGEVDKPLRTDLRNPRKNRAEYLVLGPRAFLDDAEPLLQLRRSQGLVVKAVALEDVVSAFGYGESTPEAVKEFLSYAYHHWDTTELRYVVLLGDGTYDPKDYLGTGVRNQVPVKLLKTRYLWTASDPWFASINGEDLLPDIAIGRLPAANEDEVRVLVEKIVAYETEPHPSSSRVVLVADNPDRAGDFVSDAEELASGVLSGLPLEKIYLSDLGIEATRRAIVNAFDGGASLMSYMGHGGIHLWADEDLLDIGRVSELSPQSEQPLLLTMNCLTGYFDFPYFNSLSEELLKAEGKGVIAAFSPTGLSLDEPAHQYHQALLNAIYHEGHPRLGDAVLSAQRAYADTGAFPELLIIYHLLGDPGLRLH